MLKRRYLCKSMKKINEVKKWNSLCKKQRKYAKRYKKLRKCVKSLEITKINSKPSREFKIRIDFKTENNNLFYRRKKQPVLQREEKVV